MVLLVSPVPTGRSSSEWVDGGRGIVLLPSRRVAAGIARGRTARMPERPRSTETHSRIGFHSFDYSRENTVSMLNEFRVPHSKFGRNARVKAAKKHGENKWFCQ